MFSFVNFALLSLCVVIGKLDFPPSKVQSSKKKKECENRVFHLFRLFFFLSSGPWDACEEKRNIDLEVFEWKFWRRMRASHEQKFY